MKNSNIILEATSLNWLRPLSNQVTRRSESAFEKMKFQERISKVRSRFFFFLYYKQIFSSMPIMRLLLFFLYIIITPLMLGFEKDFSCYSYLGLIRIPSLFSFPAVPFPRNKKKDGTLDLYYLSTSCLEKILLLQWVSYWVIQINCVFCAFLILQLPYQFGGMEWFNILLGSLVLTFLCGIHSRSAFGITSCSYRNSSKNSITSPTFFPLTLSRTSIETKWFHVLSSIGYSSTFVFFFFISVSISLQNWMAPSMIFQECWLSRVWFPCIWKERRKGPRLLLRT